MPDAPVTHQDQACASLALVCPWGAELAPENLPVPGCLQSVLHHRSVAASLPKRQPCCWLAVEGVLHHFNTGGRSRPSNQTLLVIPPPTTGSDASDRSFMQRHALHRGARTLASRDRPLMPACVLLPCWLRFCWSWPLCAHKKRLMRGCSARRSGQPRQRPRPDTCCRTWYCLRLSSCRWTSACCPRSVQ